jgi:hypothetical protein
MITQDCIDRMLPIVADSWEQLRGCDVFRLLDSISYESRESLDNAARIIVGKRPDLLDRVEDAASEIRCDRTELLV